MTLPVPSRFRLLVLGSLLAGAIILGFGWLSDEGTGAGEVVGYLVVVLITAAVAYLLWRFAADPRGRPARFGTLALALGIVSPFLGFVYWTGVAYAVAPAAIGLGLLARDQPPRDAKSTAAVLLGGVGLALALIGGATDALL
jgi:hypothetical protein